MKKKPLVVAIAILAVCLCAVGGTLAWLFAVAGPVENTFTVGDVSIALNEAFVDENGQADPEAERVTQNSYHIYPGAQLDKDPTATVLEGSEPCYVFICVDNALTLEDGTEVSELDISEDWAVVASQGSKTLYQYAPAQGGIVNAAAGDAALPPIFTQVVISGELVTKENISELSEKTIVVNAYAHQAAGGITKDEVIAAAEEYFGF